MKLIIHNRAAIITRPLANSCDMGVSTAMIKSRICCVGHLTPRVRAMLVMLVWTLCICCATGAVGSDAQVASNLKVSNNVLQGAALTVLRPSGCCSLCGNPPPKDVVCPAVCVDCDSVVVPRGRVVTLDPHVGPYPLPHLRIQVGKTVYCVAKGDLALVKPGATLSVGPGACRINGSFDAVGLAALVLSGRGNAAETSRRVCLVVCGP